MYRRTGGLYAPKQARNKGTLGLWVADSRVEYARNIYYLVFAVRRLSGIAAYPSRLCPRLWQQQIASQPARAQKLSNLTP